VSDGMAEAECLNALVRKGAFEWQLYFVMLTSGSVGLPRRLLQLHHVFISLSLLCSNEHSVPPSCVDQRSIWSEGKI